MKNSGRWKKIVKTLFVGKVTMVSAVVVVLFIAVAILAPVISPYDPNYTDFASFLQGPGNAHLLGTDNYGRDVLSRIIYGTRVSLIVGVFAVVIACIIGTFFDVIAGYFGGVMNDVINRIMEAIRAIPQIILAMALTAVFGSGIRDLAIILGISSMAGYVHMMRGRVLTIKQADYIIAGKLQGNKNFRLMLKHILPDSISPITVMMTQQVGQTILAEAGLSSSGLGISAPATSWGNVVSKGRLFFLQNPVFILAPNVCVAVLVVCLNMFSDGVHDALNPGLRNEVQEEAKDGTLVGNKKY